MSNNPQILRWKNSKTREQQIKNANLSYDRLTAVSEMVPLSRTQVWRLEKAGKFPKRVKLSANIIGWYRHEIEQWLRDRRGDI